MEDDEYPDDLTEEEIAKFRKTRYKNLRWTHSESSIKYFRKHLIDIYPNYKLPFSKAFLWVLRKSVFGTFLDKLGHEQSKDINENRFNIYNYELRNMSESKWEKWIENNQVFDNMYGCLKKMIANETEISLENLQQVLTTIRICEYYTNSIDNSFGAFKNLQVLILTGNNIRDINGSYLPRTLRYLELNNNFLSELINLTSGLPKTLIHLGLGRNCLNDNSYIDLIGDNIQFPALYSLDLSDNEINNLEEILESFSSLPELQSLILEGNPCYLNFFYTNLIFAKLPKLGFLDNTEILPQDRRSKSIETLIPDHPEFIFHCYRIMGLPKPPSEKNKKIQQTIHLEVTLPLLEKTRSMRPKNKCSNVPEKQNVDTQTETQRKSRTSSISKASVLLRRSSIRAGIQRQSEAIMKDNISVRSSPRKSLKKSSPYEAPDEYDEEKEARNYSFKTERMKWEQIIEFPKLVIEIPEDNLTLLRDTLKTDVCIKIIYLMFISYGDEEDKKRKAVAIPEDQEKKKLTEEILAKVTLATFQCELETLNWSDASLDFYWMEDVNVDNRAVKVDGTLNGLYFGAPKQKKITSETNLFQPIPKNFSCHFGFEVPRDIFCFDPPSDFMMNSKISATKNKK